MANKNSYVVTKKCPICGRMTRVVKTRSRLVAVKRDVDSCVHYKDFNPYFYTVWVCEHCGYAATETRFLGHLPEKRWQAITDHMRENPLTLPFREERSLTDAVLSYRLALQFAEMAGYPPSYFATLHLHLAWIYRAKGEEAERAERTELELAAAGYEESLSTEHYPVGGMSDDQATFLLAAIYTRLRDYDKAVPALSRLISNKDLTWKDRRTLEKARDLWQDIRLIRKAEENSGGEK